MTYLRKLAIAAALPAAFAFQPASAALVDVWSYEVDNTFSAFTQRGCTLSAALCAISAVTGSNANPDIGGNTRLEWGNPVDGVNHSALSVTGEVDGNDLVTNGGPSLGAVLTHENFVQTGGGHSLDTTTLTTRIILNPFLPVPNDGVDETLIADFLINFKETSNTKGNCPDGDPFATPCSDIFVISPEDLADLVQVFNYQDFQYTVQIGVNGLGPLTDEQCAAADAAAGCIGFVTEEKDTTSFQAFFTITAKPITIPEPASLALLGLTFVGLGAAGKLRKRA